MTTKNGLLLLEYQNDFLSHGGILETLIQKDESFLSQSIELLKVARERKDPIFHIPLQPTKMINNYGILKTVAESGSFKSNTWGSEFIPEMEPLDSEVIIKNKAGISAFQDTNLDSELKSKGVTSIYIAGLLTNICLESTVRDAYDRGYQVTVVRDAVASISHDAHVHALEQTLPLFSNVISLHDLQESLED